MALTILTLNGFDYWPASVSANANYDGWANNVAIAASSSYARFAGGQGVSFAGGASTSFVLSAATIPIRGVRFSFYLSNSSNPSALPSGTTYFALAFNSNTSLGACLGITSTGAVGIYNTSGAPLSSASSSGIISMFAWYEVEMKWAISGTTESVFLNVYNSTGTLIASLTYSATVSSGTTVNQVQLLSTALPSILQSGYSIWFDDCVHYSSNTATASDMLGAGPFRIQTVRPSGAGYYSQFTPNGASTNYGCVSDSYTNDGDSTYVATSTAGARDSYTHPALSGTVSSIIAVDDVAVARFDVSGTRVIQTSQRISGANYDGAQQTIANAYAPYHNVQQVSPATGNAYALAEVNAMELGIVNYS